MCERPSDLRLRAWLRSACLLPCRAALSLMLVRYCRTARPAGACCLVVPSVLCRHHAREFPLHLIRLKRFNRCGFYPIIHRLRVAMSCYSIPSGSSSLSAYPFRYLPRLPVPRLRADDAMPGPASRSSRRSAVRHVSRFPRLAILPRRTRSGWRDVVACLPVRLIGPVAVSSCGRAVSISRSGSLP